MKRVLLILVLILNSLVLNPPSANAIFGMGECEKLKSRIIAEEKIGMQSWVIFNSLADANKKISSTDLMENGLNDLLDIYSSDLKVQKDAVAHPKCFNSVQNASLRNILSTTVQHSNSIKQFLSDIHAGKKIFKHGDFGLFYKSYASLYKVIQGIK